MVVIQKLIIVNT
ncbi:hypothetical protein FWK35_00005925 [Aphis craccivora]|nr:hypothetical protein FWK35_00036436 [Aphis craccivora]KAF0766436.1 hypothetical protein FWK35_00003710 [Aphis craccivora]KAF0767035.1 hypothetical protein FWK35_00005925 [Aphis craccivora]